MCYDHPALHETLVVTVYLNRLPVKLILPLNSVYKLSNGNVNLYTRVPELSITRFSVHYKFVFTFLSVLPGYLEITSDQRKWELMSVMRGIKRAK